MVGKGFNTVYSIVLRFQLIVKGRAKILLGVEFSYATIYRMIYACVRISVICSREVVYSCRYLVRLNESSVLVVTCLIMVGRS